MEQAESNPDSLRAFTTERWFVQSGMAARGIACCSKCGEIYAVRKRREAGCVRGAGDALVNHRLPFRLADITLKALTHLLGELRISDEATKVIGKLIVEYRLET
jgi:hypothetical protein